MRVTDDSNAPSVNAGDQLTLMPVTDLGRHPRGALMLLEFASDSSIEQAVIGRVYPQRDGGLIIRKDNDPDALLACHVDDVARAWCVVQYHRAGAPAEQAAAASGGNDGPH